MDMDERCSTNEGSRKLQKSVHNFEKHFLSGGGVRVGVMCFPFFAQDRPLSWDIFVLVCICMFVFVCVCVCMSVCGCVSALVYVCFHYCFLVRAIFLLASLQSGAEAVFPLTTNKLSCDF